jgi:uncharacterized protein YdaU (DUF1376 family)
MPLYVSDYLGDTGHLSTIEHGAYMLLIMHYWQHESLPDDEVRLARIARMDSEEWSNARAMLLALFEPGWKHSRIEAEIAVCEEKYDARSKAGAKGGKASALARKQSRIDGIEANVKQSSSNATSDDGSKHQAKSNQLHPQPHPLKEEKKETRVAALSDWPVDYKTQFWMMFPNKVGKPDALAVLERVERKGVPWKTVIRGLIAYIRDKPPDRAWCNPATWLRQDRWEDQPANVSKDNGKTGNIIAASDNLLNIIDSFSGGPREDHAVCGPEGSNDVRLLSQG